MQRLDSIGLLAGGIAHDFNNMLLVILGRAEMALEGAGPADPVRRSLEEIHNAATRAAKLTQQLLGFARRQHSQPRPLDLNRTVEEAAVLLRSLLGEGVELVWFPGRGLWPVKMDPAQVDQVLMNLCVNARDALPGSGKVTIETSNATLDQAYCQLHPEMAPGDYVALSVTDNGCGIPQEEIGRIFDPFYTTKLAGEGTGLGLPTVYGIIRQNNGMIHVYSEPGSGTTFKIYIPRHRAAPQAAREQRPTEFPSSRGETVLLVEDEPSILNLGATMLERLGYKVLSANRPAQAVEIASAHVGDIDILVTDVVMPEMNGRQLAGRLLQDRPNMKVLFTSGYTANVIAHEGMVDPGVHFLAKPYSLRDLADKIRQALEA